MLKHPSRAQGDAPDRRALALDALGALASFAYQQRYIVQCAEAERRRPRELVDRAASTLGDLLDHPADLRALCAEARFAIDRAFSLLCSHAAAIPFDAIDDVEEIVLHNEHWCILRYMASETLVALGSSVETWEASNLPRGCGASARVIEPLPYEKFSADLLLVATEADRTVLLAELAAALTARLHSTSEFDDAVVEIVAELWSLGHDLLRVARGTGREIWAPEGSVWPSAPGIVIELHRSAVATVRWEMGRQPQTH